MAKRILVPIDRSPVSESIIPVVAHLARSAGSTVRLLLVYPIPGAVRAGDGRLVASGDQEMTRLEAEGASYLAWIEALLDGLAVERVIRFGVPAREIVTEASAWDADLIAMASAPGPRGIRMSYGGVAFRVRRKATVPVLLYEVHGTDGRRPRLPAARRLSRFDRRLPAFVSIRPTPHA